jgi:stress-induced morphogen
MLRLASSSRRVVSAVQQRLLSVVVEALSPAEKDIALKIEQGLKGTTSISVQDTSGGCGTMYNISVVSEAFAGKSIIKQHQLVTALLKEDIPKWHGFQLVTKTQ